MELKDYQVRVLDEVRSFLNAVAKERSENNMRHASADAWEQLRLPSSYHPRKTGSGLDLPTVCIKVPTGGGKTLLATQALGDAAKILAKNDSNRNLALWVVPSDQIYKDTLKALRDRGHFYRISLETALAQRVEVWEKHEIARLTPVQLTSAFNILILKLQGTNREDRESLKFFRDSGGNIVRHFPPEDDYSAYQALKESIPNLEMLDDDPQTGTCLAKTSVANLVRLCRPVVILDEGHKATSELARKTIEGFNPSIVIELSATPPKDHANVVSRVTGTELLAAEMIKLPINVASTRQSSWQNVVTQAYERRQELWTKALENYETGNRLIRPIVLVQVERTGNDQIDLQHIHSEHVKEYLIGRLGVPGNSVAIKTSEKDDIEGIDLLSDDCPIEWIITKAALQEGWDCPFAYILVSLSNTTAIQSMTQLVGRVLRQPFVERTPYAELNESWVYCLRAETETVVHEIRKALGKEGYEGDVTSVIDRSQETDDQANAKMLARMQDKFRSLYRKPFEGRIFLPRFCVQDEDGPNRTQLDYFRHLLSKVRLDQFEYEKVGGWPLKNDFRSAGDSFYRVALNDETLEPLDIGFNEPSGDLFTDHEVLAWLVANIGMDWYSAKQLRRIVTEVHSRIKNLDGNLARIRFSLLDRLREFIQVETDKQTQSEFGRLYDSGRLRFYLECIECRFEIPATVERRSIRPLQHVDYTGLQKNLFDFEPDDLNELEKSVALYIDKHPEVLWWYRNAVGPNEFAIRGYKRNPIFPDFIVQGGHEGEPCPKVYVVESKGAHLQGNSDSEYKRDLATYFDKIGEQVTWQQLGQDFDEHCFRFQVLDEGDFADHQWRDELNRLLTNAN